MISRALIFLLTAYKRILSPLFPPACRFIPTCSEYSIESIRRYGAAKGGFMSIRRIFRCHPWHPGGYDPVL